MSDRNSFRDFCEAVERVALVSKRTDTRLVASCPVCRKKRRLTAIPGRGKVAFTAHCGCSKDAVLDALGLTWEQLCDERAHVQKDPAPRPADWVKKYLGHARISLPIHRRPNPTRIERLGIEAIELTLGARFLAEQHGFSHPFHQFPITRSWVRIALKGEKLTDREVREIAATARSMLDHHSFHSGDSGQVFEIHQLNRLNTVSTLRDLRLALAQPPDPTTEMLLRYRGGLSSALEVRIRAMVEALERVRDSLRVGPMVLAGRN